jgi:hypothetical protein
MHFMQKDTQSVRLLHFSPAIPTLILGWLTSIPVLWNVETAG